MDLRPVAVRACATSAYGHSHGVAGAVRVAGLAARQLGDLQIDVTWPDRWAVAAACRVHLACHPAPVDGSDWSHDSPPGIARTTAMAAARSGHGAGTWLCGPLSQIQQIAYPSGAVGS